MVGVPHVTTISWNKCVESIHSWCLFTFSWSFSSDSPSFGIELILLASLLSTSGLVSSFNRSCFRLFNISLSISASNSGDLPIFFLLLLFQRFFAGGSPSDSWYCVPALSCSLSSPWAISSSPLNVSNALLMALAVLADVADNCRLRLSKVHAHNRQHELY